MNELRHEQAVKAVMDQTSSAPVRAILGAVGLALLVLSLLVPMAWANDSPREAILLRATQLLMLFGLPQILADPLRAKKGDLGLGRLFPIRWVLYFAVASLILTPTVLEAPASLAGRPGTLLLLRLVTALSVVGLVVGARAWLRLARLCRQTWVAHLSRAHRLALRASGLLLCAGTLLHGIYTLWLHRPADLARWAFVLASCIVFAAVGIRALRSQEAADLLLHDWPLCGAGLALAQKAALSPGDWTPLPVIAPLGAGSLLLFVCLTVRWHPREPAADSTAREGVP